MSIIPTYQSKAWEPNTQEICRVTNKNNLLNCLSTPPTPRRITQLSSLLFLPEITFNMLQLWDYWQKLAENKPSSWKDNLLHKPHHHLNHPLNHQKGGLDHLQEQESHSLIPCILTINNLLSSDVSQAVSPMNWSPSLYVPLHILKDRPKTHSSA